MRFADLYKDEKITSDDRTVIGNSTPDFFGAFGTNFTWKNLDLNLSFQYSYGGNVYNANYNQLAAFTGTTNNQMAFFEERWSPRNLASTQYSTMTNGAVWLGIRRRCLVSAAPLCTDQLHLSAQMVRP